MVEHNPLGSGNLPPSAQRRISVADHGALKAFAHPLRMTLYSELQRLGSATASQLGRLLGESSGQTSYHLRQLARHGFVEDDPAHQGGRERWWRTVGFDLTDPALLDDPETAASVRMVVAQTIAERATALSAWFTTFDLNDPHPSLLTSSTLTLSVAEAEALTDELNRVLKQYAATARNRPAPKDSARFRIHVDVFPVADSANPKS